jgi:hypothetical protein
VLCCVGDPILQEFNTLYLARFRTYKIAKPPQTIYIYSACTTLSYFDGTSCMTTLKNRFISVKKIVLATLVVNVFLKNGAGATRIIGGLGKDDSWKKLK